MEKLSPKEKAKQLIEKFKSEIDVELYEADGGSYVAYQCAIILVDEFIEWCKPNKEEDCGFSLSPSYDYWHSVKFELIKLQKHDI